MQKEIDSIVIQNDSLQLNDALGLYHKQRNSVTKDEFVELRSEVAEIKELLMKQSLMQTAEKQSKFGE